MNLPPEKLIRAKRAVNRWQSARKRIAGRLIASGRAGNTTPSDWDREFYQYTRQNPDMAALWGFAVIGFKPSEIPQEYIRDWVESFVRERDFTLSGSEVDRETRQIIAQNNRQDLLKPEMGFRHYAASTSVDSDRSALSYFRSESVGNAVDRICPN
jgi:hypothetical protein